MTEIDTRKPRKILICGSREGFKGSEDIPPVPAIEDVLDSWLGKHVPDLVIVGGYNGVDGEAFYWARKRRLQTCVFEPNWEAFGKGAGPLRNQAMLDHGQPDLVLAFPGGRGTADMVRRAKIAGVPVRYPAGLD